MQAELILEAQAELGEGPAWDGRAGLLYWVDIHAGLLHLFQPRTGSDRAFRSVSRSVVLPPARAGTWSSECAADMRAWTLRAVP